MDYNLIQNISFLESDYVIQITFNQLLPNTNQTTVTFLLIAWLHVILKENKLFIKTDSLNYFFIFSIFHPQKLVTATSHTAWLEPIYF